MTITPENLFFLAAGLLLGLGISFAFHKLFLSVFSGKMERISEKTLFSNTDRFLELADKYFSRFADEAKQEVTHKIEPVKHALEKYESALGKMTLEREKSFGAISAQLAEMAKTQHNLHVETGNLVKALRVPHVRGRWGEMTLKRVVETAGMSDKCDFDEQAAVGTGQGGQRPDMVVRLPGNRKIIIDAKVSLDAYLNAMEAQTEPEKTAFYKQHAAQVQKHITGLSSKSYFHRFSFTPEFVVLFIPGENFFSAALTYKPDLIETGVDKGVIPATPTTLIALLKAVAYAWRQEKSMEKAEEIRTLGIELYRRLCNTADNMNRLGRDIEKCVDTFNRTVGSMENRVMVSARKFEDLGIVSQKDTIISGVDAQKSVTRKMKRSEEQ